MRSPGVRMAIRLVFALPKLRAECGIRRADPVAPWRVTTGAFQSQAAAVPATRVCEDTSGVPDDVDTLTKSSRLKGSLKRRAKRFLFTRTNFGLQCDLGHKHGIGIPTTLSTAPCPRPDCSCRSWLSDLYTSLHNRILVMWIPACAAHNFENLL